MRPKASAKGATELLEAWASGHRCESADSLQADIGFVRSALGHEVDRSANCIALLVRKTRLADFYGIDQIRRNGIQLHVAHVFRRRQMYAVHGYIAQPWFQAAPLNILAFAFIALHGDAAQTAYCIRNAR